MPLLAAPSPFPRFVRRAVLAACGTSLIGDLHERAAAFPLRLPLSAARTVRLDRIWQSGTLFIHVPRNGGMAVCRSLYGAQTRHGTWRWYHRRAPDVAALPSFAIVREPVDRFVSAYRHAVAGGSADNRVSPPFRERYRGFRCLDEAIDHVAAAKSPYRLDHIFRPQYWYICDAAGRVGVDRLFRFGDPAIARFVAQAGGAPPLPLNRSVAAAPDVPAAQADRIRRLYRRDTILFLSAGASPSPFPPLAFPVASDHTAPSVDPLPGGIWT